MNATYVTNYGKTFLADDAKELIELMHRDSFEESASDEAFMHKIAKRVFDEYGISIPTDSAEGFVEALIEAGLVERRLA